MDKETSIKGFFKTEEGYIINKDESHLKSYRLKKQKFREINKINQDVQGLKNDISEIKQLLGQLLAKQ